MTDTQKIEILTEALRFYADRRHYTRDWNALDECYEESEIDIDFARKAVEALKCR